MGEWINVADDLPAPYQEVEVVFEGCVCRGIYKINDWLVQDRFGNLHPVIQTNEVKFWQPLPAPPRKD